MTPDLGIGGSGLLDAAKPITITIVAMGGQGGGVVADWLVGLGEAQGWVVQSTSVPGVAQRTGATVYYVEMAEPRDGRAPVLSLMPTPGDVDIVLAAEFMEAGRSMVRGLVTPDRTTLIASTHRAYAVAEKAMPGDGVVSGSYVVDAAGVAAKRVIALDLQQIADRNGSVISAALFGALAGSGLLPFPRAAFEDAVRAGGKGVTSSLRAFGAAFEQADAMGRPGEELTSSGPRHPHPDPLPPAGEGERPEGGLARRIAAEFPEPAWAMLRAGAQHLADYQDVAYADAYLDRMAVLLAQDVGAGGEAHGFALTRQAAKYLARALAFDDVIRVADLKTRASRFDRVRAEQGAKPDHILYTTEFMHPRVDEVVGMLPAALGRHVQSRGRLMRGLGKVIDHGRRVRTGTIGWFLLLYVLAGYKRHRRSTLRYQEELAHIEHWLAVVANTAPRDYDLAVEAVACRRLVKGYSDTHARGLSKFDRTLAVVPGLVGRPDSAAWLRRIKMAALADEEGAMLDGAVKTLESAFA